MTCDSRVQYRGNIYFSNARFEFTYFFSLPGSSKPQILNLLENLKINNSYCSYVLDMAMVFQQIILVITKVLILAILVINTALEGEGFCSLVFN